MIPEMFEGFWYTNTEVDVVAKTLLLPCDPHGNGVLNSVGNDKIKGKQNEINVRFNCEF